MRSVSCCPVVAAFLFGAVSFAPPAIAQVANPADHAKAQAAQAADPGPAGEVRYRSWEYPIAVDVVGQRIAPLREENPIGPYKQPMWTATRRFPTTRVYIVPEGKMEVEYWMRATVNKDGTTAYRDLYEAEFGLPHRFQLDIYLRTDRGDSGEIMTSQQLELRYALADWGRIAGNPTLYLEWIRHDQIEEPDQLEPKLLLGGELLPRWHWGVNFVGEFQMGGDGEREYSVRSGISYAVVDYKLSLGAECQASWTDTQADRGNFEESVVVGPSLQYRPSPQMTMNVAPLVGVTEDSPKAQIWFNVGWEL